MHRKIHIAIWVVVACAGGAQVQFPEALPRPTVAKEMITTLRVAGVPIVLEETELSEVRMRLGGDIERSGDASEAIAWLCLHGTDASGRWALSLWSSEVAGLNTIDGFTLQRLDRNARADRGCRTLQEGEGGFELPIALRLGLPEMQVRKILGRPTLKYRNTLIFHHEHRETVCDHSCAVSNIVAVALRSGVVWEIHVQKDTDC